MVNVKIKMVHICATVTEVGREKIVGFRISVMKKIVIFMETVILRTAPAFVTEVFSAKLVQKSTFVSKFSVKMMVSVKLGDVFVQKNIQEIVVRQ